MGTLAACGLVLIFSFLEIVEASCHQTLQLVSCRSFTQIARTHHWRNT